MLTNSFVFMDLRKVANLFASKFFEFAFDSQGLINSGFHKLIDLKQFRVWIVTTAFIWTLLSNFN